MEGIYVKYPTVSGTKETLSESVSPSPQITLDMLIGLTPHDQAIHSSGMAVPLPLPYKPALSLTGPGRASLLGPVLSELILLIWLLHTHPLRLADGQFVAWFSQVLRAFWPKESCILS